MTQKWLLSWRYVRTWESISFFEIHSIVVISTFIHIQVTAYICVLFSSDIYDDNRNTIIMSDNMI